MKNRLIKTAYLLLFTILIITQSCKKKSEEVVLSPQDLIIGEWTIEYLDPNITINGINLSNIPPELLGISEVENQILKTILSPNSSSLFDNVFISFTADGNLNITSEGISETDINYELLNENQIVIMLDDQEDISFEIIELTASNMQINTSQQLLIDLTENGQDELVEVILNATLTKNNN